MLIKAVRYRDKDIAMPPRKKLSTEEVATLEQWVKMGAPDPRSATGAVAKKTKGAEHRGREDILELHPAEKIAPPEVKDAAWPRGNIDRFILAKIEEKGMRPAPDAAPEVLLRRIFYTLTGLPPSAAEVDAFVREAADDKVTRRARTGIPTASASSW